MTAKVLLPSIINGIPVNPGDVVEVDGNTFRNLVRKGKLGEFTEEKEPTEQPQIEKKKTPKSK